MAKEDQTTVLFNSLRNIKQIRPPPSHLSKEKLALTHVAAYDVQIDGTNVILCQVPSFLIEAFSTFKRLDGCRTEGVFRKEGNALRCREDALPVFCGSQKISPMFLVHDVCSWIKKFFRDIRVPLFVNLERERKLIQFTEDLHGDLRISSLLSMLDRLPPSHMGTLAYLMRCLKEISESSEHHQMNIDNLATVFAPSLFRNASEQKIQPKILKKKNGSQEDLLKCMKRKNDLQVLVVKVLIENAAKIGIAKYGYLSSTSSKEAKVKHALIEKNAEPSKPPSGHRGGAKMKIEMKTGLLKKNSRSTSNLAVTPSTSYVQSNPNSDDESINVPSKTKQRRSNSVVRMMKGIKGVFRGTPEPAGLATKKIPVPAHHRTPLKQSVSMDPSTTSSSDDTLSDFDRQHPEFNGVGFHEIRKVMSPKDSKKRPPIPSFDCQSSNDENLSPKLQRSSSDESYSVEMQPFSSDESSSLDLHPPSPDLQLSSNNGNSVPEIIGECFPLELQQSSNDKKLIHGEQQMTADDSSELEMQQPSRDLSLKTEKQLLSIGENSTLELQCRGRDDIPASPSDMKTFDFNVKEDDFKGNEKEMILKSTTNAQLKYSKPFKFPEMGRPSIAQISGTGVVNRRIEQFKQLSTNASRTRPVYGAPGSFLKPLGKPASRITYSRYNSIPEAIAETPNPVKKQPKLEEKQRPAQKITINSYQILTP